MTTFTDGAPPSVNPEPNEGSVPHRTGAGNAERDEALDTGSSWLRAEIERRMAEGRSAGSGGRHARRGTSAASAEAIEYVPRHSVATPGPGAPRPGPVGGPTSSQAGELLRRERTAGPAWSGPPSRPGDGSDEPADPAPSATVGPPPVPDEPPAARPPASIVAPPGHPAPGGPVAAFGAVAPTPDVPAPGAHGNSGRGASKPGGVAGPGAAAAAAMRGAALGRGRTRSAASGVVAPAPAGPGTAPADPEAGAPGTALPRRRPGISIPPGPFGPGGAAPVPDATGAASPAAASPAAAPAGAAPGLVPPGTGPPARPAANPAQAANASPCVAPDTAPVLRPLPRRAASGPGPVPPRMPTGTPPAVQDSTAPTGIIVPEQRGADQLGGAHSPDPIEDLSSKRVRVVLAERKTVAHPVRTVIDIQEGTGVGELLRTNLIGSQLAVALRFAVGAGLTLGLLPLLFAMVPEIGRIEVLGLRLPWLLLGVLVYPFLFGLGLWHTRTAERVEQNFADHVQD